MKHLLRINTLLFLLISLFSVYYTQSLKAGGTTLTACTGGGPNCCSTQACGNGIISDGIIFNCTQACPIPGCPLLQSCGSNAEISNAFILCSIYTPEIPTGTTRTTALALADTPELKQATPINLGAISAPHSLNFAVPPLGSQITYTFQPTQGPLAGQTVNFVLKHLTKKITKEAYRVELLELFVQLANTTKLHFLLSITVNSAITQFTDIFPHGDFIVQPTGNFTIKHKAPPPTVIDIPKNILKKSGQQ